MSIQSILKPKPFILSKPSKRWTVVLTIIATALTGATVYYGFSQVGHQSKPSEPVKTVSTIRQITALGRLQPEAEVIRVSAPVTLSNDRIAQLLVQRGDRVKANQVIAILDSRNRLQSTLLEGQKQVKVAQAEVAKVKAGAKSGEIAAQKAEIARLQEQLRGEITSQTATISRWQSEVNIANAEYNRYLSLFKEGAIAASERDKKRLSLETAQAQLNEVRANQNRTADTLREQINHALATLEKIVEVRPVDVQAAQAEVDKAVASVKKAEADLAEVYIRAPMTGRILEIHAKPGEAVGDKGIVDLGQTDQMEVVAEVYQTDISKIRQGQQAIITSESFSGFLRGTVRQIGLQVTQQEVNSGQPGENLDRRVVEVRIRLNPKDSKRVADLTNMQVQAAIQL
ncbi:HlyD family efflux transporter periplasmic adaptor subunit [Scytonema tolypothrichoides VB-61278]|nr:HlyD family efflux transporter periplasmic adaptor subunit [Scytonema tolypothrichoides VB-61278]